ncbi:phosphatidylserine decarboxylase [Lachnospiraceae bacterium 3-1]|nr:phosphatidylserine decarboxylase [Lachnospiraceae bacterium 3-1]
MSRRKNKIVEDKVTKKETLTVRFLYQTFPGRIILKVLTRPFLSRAARRLLNSRMSRWLVPLFIKKHNIDMKRYEKKYRCFNDFFTRRRCMEEIDITPEHLISPCDGYLSVYPVSEEQIYQIKHVEYRLEELLKSRKLAKQFSGGICLVFRLTPQDYHRYCYVSDGIVARTRVIPGRLHCVRPIACETFPVFAENSREYTEIHTQKFGTIIQMEIGAMLVGKIHNYPRDGKVFQGEEKGYFEFGGSTILLLLEKDRLEVEEEILENSEKGLETRICLGEVVGVSHQRR